MRCLAADQANTHTKVDPACAQFSELVSMALEAAGMRQVGGTQGGNSSQRANKALSRSLAVEALSCSEEALPHSEKAPYA